jgi:hypothetical protein
MLQIEWNWGTFFIALGSITGAVMALTAGLKWLFSRSSDKTLFRLHRENGERFDNLSNRLGAIEVPISTIGVRLTAVEAEVQTLRKWRHAVADPHIADVKVIDRRVTTLENNRK